MAEIEARVGGAWSPPPARAPRLLALVVAGTMFMAQLDSTIIATALPQMARSFGARPVDLSLGISIYLLAQAVLLPASGWTSDRFGARRVFAIAVLLFTIASMLCGLSGSVGTFVAARIVQGASAALMTPVGRVVVVRSTRKEDLVGVLTIASTPMLLAPTLGPPVGGLIVTYLSWPWAFYLNVPVGLLSVLLILRIVPDIRADERPPFDWTGFGLTGVALAGLIYGLDRISAPAVGRALPALALAAGLGAGALAIRHATTSAHPLLSLRPLRFPTFRIPALGGGFFARIPMRALPFVLPLMFQLGLGISPVRAGLLVMALSGADLAVKPLVRRTLRMLGFRAAMMGGVAISSMGGVALAAIGRATPLPAIFAVVAAIGLARSVLFSGMSSLLYVDIDDRETGQATVLWNVVQQVTNAFAVSFTVICLNVTAWTHGGYGGAPALGDFRATLLLLAALGLPGLVSFGRLAADAGASMSGHRRGAAATGAASPGDRNPR